MQTRANNKNRVSISSNSIFSKSDLILIPLVMLLVILYAWGMMMVPFHPDESTQIYMSQDISYLFTSPTTLSYIPDQPLSAEGRYRAIDAPLARYLIGLSRSISNTPALSSDWDWELGWTENRDSGALPTNKQILVSRAAATFLLPISLIFFYFSIRTIFSIPISLIAVSFLGLHPLILLHARRAMAESFLIFGLTFFLWSITREKVRPWLAGISLAIAVCAKQTNAVLLPLGIIAVCMIPIEGRYLRKMLSRVFTYSGVLLVFWFLLNPFFWKYPFSALQTSFSLRQLLLNQQINTHLTVENLSLLERLYFLVSNLFILPPSTQEVSSYLHELTNAILKYNSYPFHTWGRGIISGSLFFTLTIGGIIIAIRSFSVLSHPKRRPAALFGLAFLFLLIVNLLIPIPWQRYSLGLIPFIVILSSFGLSPIISSISRLVMSHK